MIYLLIFFSKFLDRKDSEINNAKKAWMTDKWKLMEKVVQFNIINARF